MSNELKLGKIITFSGKKVEWPVWSEKFMARANRKGYKKILLGEDKEYIVPLDSVDLDAIKDNDNEKHSKMLKEKNQEAFEDLILAIDGDTEIGRVVFPIDQGEQTSWIQRR